MQVLMLNDVRQLLKLDPNRGIDFGAEERRNVRLELNCEAPTVFRVLWPGGRGMQFLAKIEGRASVSFVADGPVQVFAEPEFVEGFKGPDFAAAGRPGEVWWWSSETESFATVIPDAETFTTIAERKARNPELELIMQKMMQNVDRRMADLTYEVEQREARQSAALAEAQAELEKERKRAAKRKSKAPAGGVGADGEQGGGTATQAAGGDEGGGSDAGDGED